jgi:hypothetical protein
MKRKPQPEDKSIERKIEVKIGSRLVIVEQCELDNLIEALSEMKSLAASGRALMSIGSSSA